MKRKVIAILLSVCVLFCFASCEGTKTEVHIDNNIDNNIDNQIQQGDSDIDIQETPNGTESTTEEKAPVKEETTKKQETTTKQPPKTDTNVSAHVHSYSTATCTQPRSCSCGATIGSSLGHSFSSATCTSPKLCSRCGTASGLALGHNYSNATCTSAKKCSRCGATSGSALGHNYVNNKCSRCGKTDPNSLPVGLESLHVIDSQYYKYKTGTFKDSFGNIYNGAHYFERLYNSGNGREPHAMFNLNGNYSKFSGSIVAAENTDPEWTYYINIYVDGVLRFSKTGFSKTCGKVNFEIDVRNGQTLDIRMGLESTTGDSNQDVAIVNAQLTK